MRTLMRFRSLLTALMVLFVTMYGPVLGVAAGVGTSAVASADSGANYCVGLFTPGYWKNYAKNGAPLLTGGVLPGGLLPNTLDFGATLPYGQTGAGANYTADFAVSVLQLEGKYVLRSLLSAELNVANSGLANNSFPSLSTTLTVGQLLDQAYKDYQLNGTAIPTPTNGLLASTPAIPSGFTTADQTLVAYVGNGGGEGASTSTCKLGPPLPAPVSDLSIVKTVDKTAVLAGDDLTYTIVAKNDGPDAASNVSVSDAVPANTTFISLAPAAGWSCASGPAFPCTIATLAAHATATFKEVVLVNAGTPGKTVITNTAMVSPTDSTPDDNTATVKTPVTPVGDLAIVKTVDQKSVLAGTTLHYTIIASNGGDPASDVTVTDLLPADTTLVSFSAPAGWTCTGGYFPCSIPTFNGGASAAFAVAVQVNGGTAAGTDITNTATVSPTDSTPDDNTSTVTTPVRAPVSDLAIVKTVNKGTVSAGDTLTYTITATNAGPDAAANAMVSDPLPANTTFVSLTPAAGWSCASGPAFPCSVASFASGASATFTEQVQVNAGTPGGTDITNTATVSPTDSTPTDNTSAVKSTVIASCSATSDTITGHYTDNNGNVIANQVVWLLTSQGGTLAVDAAITGSNGGAGYAQTDSAGNFSFGGLQPGAYVVRETVRNDYATISATLNGVLQSPTNTTDVAVTINSNCDQENVVFTIGPAASVCTTAPVLTNLSGGLTTPDGHPAASVTIQSAAGVTTVQLTGTNVMVYSVNGVVQSPEPQLPTVITLTTPYPTSVTIVLERVNSAVSGQFDTNASDANSCVGDPSFSI
jgi:uncharacterized repeat protein (TIGR01451 family)